MGKNWLTLVINLLLKLCDEWSEFKTTSIIHLRFEFNHIMIS